MGKVLICENCGKKFDPYLVIGGKRQNASNRKFCYGCSPHGAHNCRADLSKPKWPLAEYRKMYKRHRHNAVKVRAVALKGGKCIYCGYNKCTAALDFHHRNPETKEFTITSKVSYKWERIEKELEKCDLVCANCHRELEVGLLAQE